MPGPRRKQCCKECKGEEDLEHVETPEKYHKAKMVCRHCKAFHQWTASLAKQKLRKERQEIIDKILAVPEIDGNTLTAKQRQFLTNIRKLNDLSPSQWRYFEGLKAHMLGSS